MLFVLYGGCWLTLEPLWHGQHRTGVELLAAHQLAGALEDVARPWRTLVVAELEVLAVPWTVTVLGRRLNYTIDTDQMGPTHCSNRRS